MILDLSTCCPCPNRGNLKKGFIRYRLFDRVGNVFFKNASCVFVASAVKRIKTGGLSAWYGIPQTLFKLRSPPYIKSPELSTINRNSDVVSNLSSLKSQTLPVPTQSHEAPALTRSLMHHYKPV